MISETHTITQLGENQFSELLTDADIGLLLSNQKVIIRELDRDVTNLIQIKHKLEHAQKLKDKVTITERNLVDIHDLVEDKIAEALKRDEEVAFKQALLKNCDQLIVRQERIKKNLADDISACRYLEAKEAIDPLKIVGSVIGFPLTAAGLTRLFEGGVSKPVVYSATAGGALGVVFSFHRQIRKGWNAAANSVCKNGQEIRDSFMLYYIKEKTKEKAKKVRHHLKLDV